MPRYFIDTDDDTFALRDDVGHDLVDLRAARDAAHRALPDMARQKMPDSEHRTFRASVRDESGAVVYVATLVLAGVWMVTPPIC
ncbi:hypothetical protein MPAR168_23445 [Methylorubrum populi]|uniref:DUF6894 domain-containing protein n=1 Tax=Methylobacterium radiotolerans TaxID=31998 RepID=A0ABU7TH21_9HYPH